MTGAAALTSDRKRWSGSRYWRLNSGMSAESSQGSQFAGRGCITTGAPRAVRRLTVVPRSREPHKRLGLLQSLEKLLSEHKGHDVVVGAVQDQLGRSSHHILAEGQRREALGHAVLQARAWRRGNGATTSCNRIVVPARAAEALRASESAARAP